VFFGLKSQNLKTDEPAKWDKQLTALGVIVFIVAGLLAYFVVSFIEGARSGSVPSGVIVPTLAFPATTDPNVASANFIQNTLFQFALVAPAEELMVAAVLYAAYQKFGKSEFIAVGVSRGLWAGLHTLIAGWDWTMLGIGLLLGVIFYLTQRQSGSVLSPIVAHGEYNTVINVARIFYGVFQAVTGIRL
jgi:hypothetical protein